MILTAGYKDFRVSGFSNFGFQGLGVEAFGLYGLQQGLGFRVTSINGFTVSGSTYSFHCSSLFSLTTYIYIYVHRLIFILFYFLGSYKVSIPPRGTTMETVGRV